MWPQDESTALLDIQQQRLQFLKNKAQVLERRLQQLRSEVSSFELMNIDLNGAPEKDLTEINNLKNHVNKLKAEYYCLEYQCNVYNGVIPAGLLDYAPDQQIERPSSAASTMDTNETSERLNVNSPTTNHYSSSTSSSINGSVSNDRHYSSNGNYNHNDGGYFVGGDGACGLNCSKTVGVGGEVVVGCVDMNNSSPRTPTRNMARTETSSPRPSTSQETTDVDCSSVVDDLQNWSCPKCSFSNHYLIDVCEICDHSRKCFKLNNNNEGNNNVSSSDPSSNDDRPKKCLKTDDICYCHLHDH